MRILTWVVLLITFICFRCQRGDLNHTYPEHFPTPVYTFSHHPNHKAVFELGRELFYDPILSIDSSISCASCHHQSSAFSDSLPRSRGVRNQLSKRHSPALINLAWQPYFMWDGGINHIEVMPVAPITDHLEMDMPLQLLLERLNKNDYYVAKFKKLWQRDSIDDQILLWSLAKFTTSLVSANSKYDQYLQGKINLNEEELKGLNLFEMHCVTCHTPPLFTNFSFEKNTNTKNFSDSGRYLITRIPEDLGKFKVPTLRNIALTSPYMHDGRYGSLEEVIDHYISSSLRNQQNSDLHSDLYKGNGQFYFLNDPLLLSLEDKKALISFLHTLTDEDFITNSSLSNPFVSQKLRGKQ